MPAEAAQRSPLLRALAVLALLICLAILGSLGTWQASRFLERKDIFERMDAGQALPVVEVVSATQLLPAFDYRTIELSGGRLQMDQTVLVERRFHKHLPGDWTVTPYIFADGTAVWVHTGWIPEDQRELAAHHPALLRGLVVTPNDIAADDIARSNPKFTLENHPVIGELDLELLYDALEPAGPPRDFSFVVLNGPGQPKTYPTPSHAYITDPYLTPAVHFGYATLWYGSGLLLIWLFWAGWTGRLDPTARRK